MRKTLLTLTALAGLVGAGAIGTASAATTQLETIPATDLVQPVQYYYGYHHGPGYRAWVHHRRWAYYHGWHRGHYWHRW